MYLTNLWWFHVPLTYIIALPKRGWSSIAFRGWNEYRKSGLSSYSHCHPWGLTPVWTSKQTEPQNSANQTLERSEHDVLVRKMTSWLQTHLQSIHCRRCIYNKLLDNIQLDWFLTICWAIFWPLNYYIFFLKANLSPSIVEKAARLWHTLRKWIRALCLSGLNNANIIQIQTLSIMIKCTDRVYYASMRPYNRLMRILCNATNAVLTFQSHPHWFRQYMKGKGNFSNPYLHIIVLAIFRNPWKVLVALHKGSFSCRDFLL